MIIAHNAEQLPSMPEVAAVLRASTEHLASELANPQANAPDWSEFEWRIARAVSAMHCVSGLLAGTLRWRGPDGWAEFLSEQREQVARRQLRLHELLSQIGERCEREGIPVQALKGAALHREGLYQPGQRTMADLDLLSSPQNAEPLAKILESFGLRESHRTRRERVFEPHERTPPRSFGEHADNDVKVELHDRIFEPLPYRLTDISHLVTLQDAVPGLNPYPSRASLMAHLLLHAAGGMAYRTVRLVQLHDIALLAARLTSQDWETLRRWRPWWAWPPLALTERYYGALGPQWVTTALRTACPVILRGRCARQRLTDVSLSRLWVEAFPGLEWAGSVGEAMTFIARRIVPSEEVRSERKFALATDPSLAQDDWVGLPQSRRILRALCKRTPRPWPLHNVRAALSELR